MQRIHLISGPSLDDYHLTEVEKQLVEYVLPELIAGAPSSQQMVIMVKGMPGSGKTHSIEVMTRMIPGAQLWAIPAGALLHRTVGDSAKAVANLAAFVTSRWAGPVVLYFYDAETFLGRRGHEPRPSEEQFAEMLRLLSDPQFANAGMIVVMCTNRGDRIDPAIMSRVSLVVEVNQRSTEDMTCIVQNMAAREGFAFTATQVAELAATNFPLRTLYAGIVALQHVETVGVQYWKELWMQAKTLIANGPDRHVLTTGSVEPPVPSIHQADHSMGYRRVTESMFGQLQRWCTARTATSDYQLDVYPADEHGYRTDLGLYIMGCLPPRLRELTTVDVNVHCALPSNLLTQCPPLPFFHVVDHGVGAYERLMTGLDQSAIISARISADPESLYMWDVRVVLSNGTILTRPVSLRSAPVSDTVSPSIGRAAFSSLTGLMEASPGPSSESLSHRGNTVTAVGTNGPIGPVSTVSGARGAVQASRAGSVAQDRVPRATSTATHRRGRGPTPPGVGKCPEKTGRSMAKASSVKHRKPASSGGRASSIPSRNGSPVLDTPRGPPVKRGSPAEVTRSGDTPPSVHQTSRAPRRRSQPTHTGRMSPVNSPAMKTAPRSTHPGVRASMGDVRPIRPNMPAEAPRPSATHATTMHHVIQEKRSVTSTPRLAIDRPLPSRSAGHKPSRPTGQRRRTGPPLESTTGQGRQQIGQHRLKTTTSVRTEKALAGTGNTPASSSAVHSRKRQGTTADTTHTPDPNKPPRKVRRIGEDGRSA